MTKYDIRKLARTVLFTPSDRESAMRKAITSLNADVVVFDLEDAVSPHRKKIARQNVINLLSNGPISRCEVVVRVNCPRTTEWGADDIKEISNCFISSLILPKVEESSTVDKVSQLLRESNSRFSSLWCMIETPKGVQNVDAIADLPNVQSLVFGSNDLTKELKAKHTYSREPLLYSMSKCILAARASGIQVIDGVHMNINDEKGLIDSCIQGKNLGFDGKSLIHPNQIKMTNKLFSPSEEDIENAYRMIEQYELALRDGKGVMLMDDKLVEQLHVDHAKLLISEYENIMRMEKLRGNE
mmetsp:Transcript_19237/g.18573  ORF Transcript_19237/g.18573 Transcript_19237/m.18573 type:complete len:299 (-) Transcript_19237:677-1573(-)|eukprot:CAMPEP_0119047666 /NCGR_PEP_ID=MMETSP1177-20130426/54373_1 /TAXON_ID=2985 /ORGANISM="Ochromonas sp, Strain CCMP1899" /LENGTH=298 /DNA_ID=CAMNT_0007022509 /DNA_START=131 /DNA_END=1027 /DNA_ORIENTATION=-